MGIAIIGWGSLIWDIECLGPHIAGDWRRTGGPRLPLEFSRISPKRRLSLVLALDPEHGRPLPSSYVLSARTSLDAAIDDLAARERAPRRCIGFLDRRNGEALSRLPEIPALVEAWAAPLGLDAALWTDLDTNFAAETGVPFSLDAGYDYLTRLSGDGLAEAKRYIDFAPMEIKTPLRQRLDDDAWWRSLPAPAVPA